MVRLPGNPARPSTLSCLQRELRQLSGGTPAAQFRCRSPKACAMQVPNVAVATQRQAFAAFGTLLDRVGLMSASMFSSTDAGLFVRRVPRRLSQSSPISVVLAEIARRRPGGRVPFGGGCDRRSAGARSLRRPRASAAEPNGHLIPVRRSIHPSSRPELAQSRDLIASAARGPGYPRLRLGFRDDGCKHRLAGISTSHGRPTGRTRRRW